MSENLQIKSLSPIQLSTFLKTTSNNGLILTKEPLSVADLDLYDSAAKNVSEFKHGSFICTKDKQGNIILEGHNLTVGQIAHSSVASDLDWIVLLDTDSMPLPDNLKGQNVTLPDVVDYYDAMPQKEMAA